MQTILGILEGGPTSVLYTKTSSLVRSGVLVFPQAPPSWFKAPCLLHKAVRSLRILNGVSEDQVLTHPQA